MFVWICVLCKTWLGTCTAVMMIMIMILLMIIMILLMMIMIFLMMIMILLMMMIIMILMQWSHPSPLIYPSISSHPSTSPISSAYPSHVSTYLIHPFIHHLCADSRWSSGVRGAFKDGGEASPQDPQSARWVSEERREWMDGWIREGRWEAVNKGNIYGAKADEDDTAML